MYGSCGPFVHKLKDQLYKAAMASSYGSIGREGRELELEAPEKKTQLTESTSRSNSIPWKVVAPIASMLLIGLAWFSSSGGANNNHSVFDESKVKTKSGVVTVAADEGLFFDDQLVDHHHKRYSAKYSQRYYEKKDYFGGPGSPIFVIFGGEDPLEGLLYPFVYDHLAKDFQGYTASLEHRFYGESTPVEDPTHDELHALLSPNQAIWDAARFIQYKREELGCSLDRTSKDYCPAISVGGSYPGFLSSLMRFVHSDVVDISYASSAPFRLYSHHVHQGAYYEKVTTTADEASPGCADAVRTALLAAQEDIVNSLDELLQDVAVKYGVCRGSVPKYIETSEIFSQELMLIIATHFANGNMDYYPPGPEQDFVKGCYIFQDPKLKTPEEKIAAYLKMGNGVDDDSDCFDMMTELPPGPNGTISASDWSGVGAGAEGFFWDYQSCQLIPECGFSEQSMFPPRHWELAWVADHCMDRFDWMPDPLALNREFGFDDLSKVSRLLLTNGIVDGWSIASILEEDVSPGIKVVNMVNGAHHSDLSHGGPSENDTPDVKEAFVEITATIGKWLDDVRDARTEDKRMKTRDHK